MGWEVLCYSVAVCKVQKSGNARLHEDKNRKRFDHSNARTEMHRNVFIRASLNVSVSGKRHSDVGYSVASAFWCTLSFQSTGISHWTSLGFSFPEWHRRRRAVDWTSWATRSYLWISATWLRALEHNSLSIEISLHRYAWSYWRNSSILFDFYTCS